MMLRMRRGAELMRPQLLLVSWLLLSFWADGSSAFSLALSSCRLSTHPPVLHSPDVRPSPERLSKLPAHTASISRGGRPLSSSGSSNAGGCALGLGPGGQRGWRLEDLREASEPRGPVMMVQREAGGALRPCGSGQRMPGRRWRGSQATLLGCSSGQMPAVREVAVVRRQVPCLEQCLWLLQKAAVACLFGCKSVLKRLVVAGILFVSTSALAMVPAATAASLPPASSSVLEQMYSKFVGNWKLYCTIPVIAGLLNWATNNLAVKMIFYPLSFWGLKIKTYPETPMGWIGWTGIVPAKAKTMATRMVQMVTSQLIDITMVAKRVEPQKVEEILSPKLESLLFNIAEDLKVKGTLESPLIYEQGRKQCSRFVTEFTTKMQENVDQILDLEGMVVQAMVDDKQVLVELFQECGGKELDFVVKSGLYFGFLLGCLQMLVWLTWDPWWSLALGGAVVGYLTNFFAIKSIFEPVEPVKIGPLKLQGLFLTRQQEVSGQFATFLRTRVLTAENLWTEVLYGRRRAGFDSLLDSYIEEFLKGGWALQGATLGLGKEKISKVLHSRIRLFLEKEYLSVCPYLDDALLLESEMREKMGQMSSGEFEQVLHPIFQEDEATLILVGALLGFSAGFLQSLAPY